MLNRIIGIKDVAINMLNVELVLFTATLLLLKRGCCVDYKILAILMLKS